MDKQMKKWKKIEAKSVDKIQRDMYNCLGVDRR